MENVSMENVSMYMYRGAYDDISVHCYAPRLPLCCKRLFKLFTDIQQASNSEQVPLCFFSYTIHNKFSVFLKVAKYTKKNQCEMYNTNFYCVF